MHRKYKEPKLLLLDTEIERTLWNLKKVREVEKATMAEQRDVNQNFLVVAVGIPQQRQRTMEDLQRLVIRKEYSVTN